MSVVALGKAILETLFLLKRRRHCVRLRETEGKRKRCRNIGKTIQMIVSRNARKNNNEKEKGQGGGYGGYPSVLASVENTSNR